MSEEERARLQALEYRVGQLERALSAPTRRQLRQEKAGQVGVAAPAPQGAKVHPAAPAPSRGSGQAIATPAPQGPLQGPQR